MWPLKTRLSKDIADEIADAIAGEYRMRGKHPAVKKVRRLAELGPKEESDLFDLDELNAIATVTEPEESAGYPQGYVELRAEVTRILTTGS